jgi:broad specificity phosphatase PhoE
MITPTLLMPSGLDMEIILIRHGQTDGNRAWRHQHPNTRLNEVGKEQVARLTDAVIDFAPTHLITSTNLRAVETARVLAEATGLTPATSDLFEELRRPSFLIGHRFVGVTTITYLLGWFYGKKHHDGESYPEFIDRLLKARAYLETLPPDARVAVVSHSVFINLFVEHRCRPYPIPLPRALLRFLRIMSHKNTGITHLRFTPEDDTATCAWTLFKEGAGGHLR